jgi:cytochrome P450
LFEIPLHLYYRYLHLRYIGPVIHSRLPAANQLSTEKDFISSAEFNDFLQWAFQRAETLDHKTAAWELQPYRLTCKVIGLNYTGIHTTGITMTNAILDLVSSDSADLYIKELREEVTQVMAEMNNTWTKSALLKLSRTDSVLRESMRLSSIIPHALTRSVIADTGITLPTGQHIPKGNRVAVCAYGIHQDSKFFTHPHKYDGFRFVPPMEGSSAYTVSESIDEQSDSERQETHDADKKESVVTTSLRFLPFGHGRHSCAGRFFVVDEMKLILAFIVLNYDIQRLEKRPANTWFWDVTIPSMNARIKVRRRKFLK